MTENPVVEALRHDKHCSDVFCKRDNAIPIAEAQARVVDAARRAERYFSYYGCRHGEYMAGVTEDGLVDLRDSLSALDQAEREAA